MIRHCVAAAIGATAFGAMAQQPVPPAFAPPNLTPVGVQSMAANCAPCHGTNGKPVAGSTVAALAGRSAAELADIMEQFKEGKRQATVMHQIAKGFSEPEIHAISTYFSKLPR
jgi:cytochrome c553